MKINMKKVGVATKENVSVALRETCDVIITLAPQTQTAETFYTLVKECHAHELYMDEVSDVDLRLSELVKGLTYLTKNNKIIHYLDKGELNNLNDQTYFNLLVELAKNEKETVKPLLSLNLVWPPAMN